MRFLSLALFFCVACGGGGGGGGGGEATSLPVANLIAPLPDAVTEADVLTVYGTAERATSVTVNGVRATSKDGFANWRLSVELRPGENTLVVEARNEAGATTVTRQAVQRQVVVSGARWMTFDPIRKIFYMLRLDPGALVGVRDGVAYLSDDEFAAEDPDDMRRWRGAYSADRESVFLYDPVRGELFSWFEETRAITLVSSATRGVGPAFETRLGAIGLAVDDVRGSVILVHSGGALEIDIASGDRRTIALPTGVPLGMAYNAVSQELFIWHSTTNWPVSATNLATGASRQILSRTNWVGGSPFDVDPANNRLLVANGNQSGEEAFGIHAYDLDTGAHTRLADHQVNRPVDLVSENGTLYLLDSDYTRSMIRRFDLATGAETTEWRSGRGEGPDLRSGEGMTFDPVRNKLVVASSNFGDGSVLLVDPRTGDRETWLALGTNPSSIAYAEARDEFAVGLYDEVVLTSRDAMDETRLPLDEGTRRPDHLVLDTANQGAWYWNGALFRVDFATGVQTLVDVPLDDVAALVLDPTRNVLFAADDGPSPRLQKLDVATETLTPVPNGVGDVTALAMAADGTRLLVGKRNELHLVDPDSSLGTVLSGPLMGSGITLGHAEAIVLDPRDPNWVYVLSGRFQIQIVRVDLRTGDRYLVSK